MLWHFSVKLESSAVFKNGLFFFSSFQAKETIIDLS